MKKMMTLAAAIVFAVPAIADTFGTGNNQFTIDFVTISGSTNPTSGIPAGYRFTFTGVANDYRMGTYEITNAQFAKFASNSNVYWPGADVPTNNVSWYEAAQFVNWLNIEAGKTAAYKFTGTPGTSNYSLGVWSASDAGYNAANPFRNSNAKYFLPTENEWVKAAYWNGTNLQTYATKAGESLYQGNGSNGGWNYDYVTMQQAWNVGSGSQELNGTYDMMGNVWEWMESPYKTGDYTSGSLRGVRGGSYYGDDYDLSSSYRNYGNPHGEGYDVGFRVASIPEPCTLLLLSIGGLLIRNKFI